jgi:hypothetical protein
VLWPWCLMKQRSVQQRGAEPDARALRQASGGRLAISRGNASQTSRSTINHNSPDPPSSNLTALATSSLHPTTTDLTTTLPTTPSVNHSPKYSSRNGD